MAARDLRPGRPVDWSFHAALPDPPPRPGGLRRLRDLGHHLRAEPRRRRPGHGRRRRQRHRRRSGRDPGAIRVRPAVAPAIRCLPRRRDAGRSGALVPVGGAGHGAAGGAYPGDRPSGRSVDPLRAGAGGAPRRAGRAAAEFHAGPQRTDACGGRAGGAELLGGAAADPALRGQAGMAADLGLVHPRAFRPARDHARLLRDAGADAVDPRRHDRGAGDGLYPHRAGDGPVPTRRSSSSTPCATPSCR